ncbi:MAG TPA: hypothetical protein VFA15_04770 [Nitrososphaera sp.]|nr:hypothetical protein [Nitrososphaera sp.]
MTSNQRIKKAYLVIGMLLIAGILGSYVIKPVMAFNGISVSAGVISPGGSEALTQVLDSPAIGTVTAFIVFLPNNMGSCVPKDGMLPAATPLTLNFPTDFKPGGVHPATSCDTTVPGSYEAEDLVDVSGVVKNKSFEVIFVVSEFVAPESPIGIAALMGSSMAALSAFIALRKHKASVNSTN